MMSRRHHAASRTHRNRLQLEALEERTVLNGAAAYGQLPLAFETNHGQAGAVADFVANSGAGSIRLNATQAVLDLGDAGNSLSLQVLGADPAARAVAEDPLITRVNYLTGNDPSQWLTDIPTFGTVEYDNVYPGIDLVYHGNQGRLEYDFIVQPGANPKAIRMAVDGASSLRINARGELVMRTEQGKLVQQAPVLYQDIDGVREHVAGRFKIQGDNQYGFKVGRYDHTLPLVIDPVLSYSTYLPGQANELAVDSAGNAYVTGQSNGSIFVTKVDPTGTAVVYTTILGDGEARDIAVDASGKAYVTGDGTVTTTANAFSQTGPGSFVTVLDTTGSGLMYSSYIAAGASKGYGIAVDNSGNTYITGSVNITSPLPTTAGAFQSTHAGQISDAFVAKFNPNLSGAASLVYSTYLGGPNSPSSASYGFDTGVDIAVDASGNAYVLGHTGSTAFPTTAGAFQRSYGGTVDLFIAKINPVLSGTASLVYSTYLGGKHWDYAGGIAVDSSGNAYVTGDTWSSNFPATRGAYLTKAGFLPFPETGPTAFVTKVNPAGTDLVYSTFLAKVMKSPFGKTYTGTSNWTYSTLGTDIAVDASGAAYLTGRTASASFPVVNPIQSSRAGITDAFITKLNATGSGLLFSTYLGGSGDTDMGTGIAVVGSNTIYVLGATDSTNFPVTAGALQTTNDTGGVVGFLSKITL